MPWGGRKNHGLLPCFTMYIDQYLSEPVQAKGRRTLMNLTSFFLVSYSAFHIVIPGYGKRVQVPRGPAAVNGDETRQCHCLFKT